MLDTKHKEYLIYLLEQSLTERNAAYDGIAGKKLLKEHQNSPYRVSMYCPVIEKTSRNMQLQKVIDMLKDELNPKPKPKDSQDEGWSINIDIGKFPPGFSLP